MLLLFCKFIAVAERGFAKFTEKPECCQLAGHLYSHMLPGGDFHISRLCGRLRQLRRPIYM
jgi:hypothetical protein